MGIRGLIVFFALASCYLYSQCLGLVPAMYCNSKPFHIYCLTLSMTLQFITSLIFCGVEAVPGLHFHLEIEHRRNCVILYMG
jgi:hypothetical protein